MAGIPGFGAYGTNAKPSAAVPHSHACGNIEAPWNVGVPVFRYRAPVRMTMKNATLFAGSIESPSGCPVVVEAWKNGVYGGSVTLENGPTSFDQTLQLQPMDLIELRLCVRGTGDAPTRVNDFWVMFAT